MRTLANAANVDGFHMRWREGLGKGLRAIELARNVDEPQAEMRALLWTAAALAATGEPRRAVPHAEAMLALAEKLRDRWWLSLALIANASLCRTTGLCQVAGSFSD